ncbi:cellulase family glycosylhydrolase [Lentzea alba]|uniref:cellulase family glycosylhydrolase n=1 Tax=Lentzea alba TaxID=2714351 RepID=UPI001A93F725|nr:cellulase family glycosylhydrolase [Lentzea alba]
MSGPFFTDLARRNGHLPNVIWEPWNEPLQVSWNDVMKPYDQAVVNAIRSVDPDNGVVLGTPTWSQDVDRLEASEQHLLDGVEARRRNRHHEPVVARCARDRRSTSWWTPESSNRKLFLHGRQTV